jgi:hypothetical protein
MAAIIEMKPSQVNISRVTLVQIWNGYVYRLPGTDILKLHCIPLERLIIREGDVQGAVTFIDNNPRDVRKFVYFFARVEKEETLDAKAPR